MSGAVGRPRMAQTDAINGDILPAALCPAMIKWTYGQTFPLLLPQNDGLRMEMKLPPPPPTNPGSAQTPRITPATTAEGGGRFTTNPSKNGCPGDIHITPLAVQDAGRGSHNNNRGGALPHNTRYFADRGGDSNQQRQRADIENTTARPHAFAIKKQGKESTSK